MQFESRSKRALSVTATLGLLPDAVIAAILARVFDGGVVGFLGALIGLEVLYVLIWAKNSIWSWVVFSLSGRKRLASHVLDYFRANKYPEPEIYEKSADGYLATVVESERAPVAVRLKAASDLGAIRFLESSGQVQRTMQINIAYEDALEQFKRFFPVQP